MTATEPSTVRSTRASTTTDSARFAARVLAVVRRIPAGRVATYGDVAARAGSPLAHRAVGNIMRTCTRGDVPCHRVIAAGGRLGGYGSSLELKRGLLRAEGVTVSGSIIRDFPARRWGPPALPRRPSRTTRPKAT